MTEAAADNRAAIIPMLGWPPLWLLWSSLLLRLVVALAFGDREPTIVDAHDYNRLATALVETGEYVTESGAPSSLRPPLYPAVLAGVYRVLGVHNYLAVAVLQALLSWATIFLSYWIGALLYRRETGVIAATLVGFYPSLLAFNMLLLSETLFTFLLTGAVFASLVLLRSPGIVSSIALGTCLGLGALTRSVLWLCSAPVGVAILLLAMYSPIRRFLSVGIALSVCAAVLAPWSWRNTRVQETFTLIDVMGGRNVMMGNYEYTPLERSWATISDVTGERSWHRVLAAATPGYSQLTQGEIDKKAMAYGVRYFFSHPAESARRCLVRFFNFWQLERTIIAGMRQGYFGDIPTFVTVGVALLICGSYALVALLALTGAVVTPPEWRSHTLLLLWIAVPCAIHTVAFAHSRYHLPLIPVLTVYAAAALQALWSDRSRFSGWRGPVALTLCVILVLGWAREIVFVDLGLMW